MRRAVKREASPSRRRSSSSLRRRRTAAAVGAFVLAGGGLRRTGPGAAVSLRAGRVGPRGCGAASRGAFDSETNGGGLSPSRPPRRACPAACGRAGRASASPPGAAGKRQWGARAGWSSSASPAGAAWGRPVRRLNGAEERLLPGPEAQRAMSLSRGAQPPGAPTAGARSAAGSGASVVRRSPPLLEEGAGQSGREGPWAAGAGEAWLAFPQQQRRDPREGRRKRSPCQRFPCVQRCSACPPGCRGLGRVGASAALRDPLDPGLAPGSAAGLAARRGLAPRC